jgi:hypothetical protein
LAKIIGSPGRMVEVESAVSFCAEQASQTLHAASAAKNSVQKNDAFIAHDSISLDRRQ